MPTGPLTTLAGDVGAFVGRDVELAQVGAALNRPDLAGIVLVGAPGVGKSRLARAAAERAAAAGFVTTRIFGSSVHRDLPFSACAPLVRAGADDAVEAFAGVRQALRDLAGHRPLLLVVDDAHLLDDASALAVHQVAADLLAFVVCVVRAGETAPDAITALWKEGLAARIDVGPFDAVATANYLAGVLGGPVDPFTVDALWRRSGGNALHLYELVRHALVTDAFRPGPAGWRLGGELRAPDRLADLVEKRLGELTADQRTALTLVSLAEPLALAVAERVIDPAVLEGLEADGWIVAGADSGRFTVRPAHPLYADVLRAQVPALRRRGLLRRLADASAALDALGVTGSSQPDDVLQRAVWRLDGGGDIDAPTLTVAARLARLRQGPELAERLARAAVAAGGAAEAHRQLGLVLHQAGRHDDAAAVLATAERVAVETADAAGAVAIARTQAVVAYWGHGDRAGAVAHLERTAGSPTGVGAGADAHALWALIDAHTGPVGDALARVERARAAGATGLSTVLAAAVAHTAAGRPDAALAEVATARRRPAWEAADTVQRSLDGVEALALVEAGRLAEAGALVVDAALATLRSGDVRTRAELGVVAAWVAYNRGRLSEADGWLADAVHLARASGHTQVLRWALGLRLVVAAERGDVDAGGHLHADLDALPGDEAGSYGIHARRGRAAWLARNGDVAGALAAQRALVAWCAERSMITVAARIAVDAARTGGPAVAAELLAAATAAADGGGPLHAALRGWIGGLADDDGPALGATSAALADLGADLLAARAAVDARDASQRRGDARAANAWARRGAELAERCDGGAASVLFVADTPVPLTRREREIATLVADGLSARAVAERLYLSIRTVENHLARAYDKLGVSSRAELVGALDHHTVPHRSGGLS